MVDRSTDGSKERGEEYEREMRIGYKSIGGKLSTVVDSNKQNRNEKHMGEE